MKILLLTLLASTLAPAATLPLDEALAMALRNNLDLKIERENITSAQQAESGAHGFRNPVFHWNPQFQILNNPTPSILSGQDGKLEQHQILSDAGFHQRTWQGGIFDLTVTNSRVTTNDLFVGLNPYYTAQITLAYVQPLWKGRAIDSDRAILKIRGVETGIARTRLELRAIDIITRVEQAYWNLAAARDAAAVDREAADLARTQLEQNRRMIVAGTLPAVELAASEAELQRRLDNWYSSLESITDYENTLKSLLASPRHDDPIWDREIMPDASQAPPQPEPTDRKQAIAEALKQRPELRAIEQQLEVNSIEEQQNADQTRPALNFVASYSNTGISGTLRNTPDPITSAIEPYAIRINDLSAASGLAPLPPSGFGTLPSSSHYQGVQAGFNFEYTLHNRQARANLDQTVTAGRTLKLQRTRTEQSIEVEVRNALQSLETAKQRIVTGEAGVRAAREKLESEQRLFEHGESTNFLVLTRQNEYSDARRRLLSAHLDYNQAVTRFHAATGVTLASRNLVLEP